MEKLNRPIQYSDTKRKYNHILPGPEEWPVVQMARNRKGFLEELIAESISRIKELRPRTSALVEELEITRYREKLRYKTNPWKVDPEDEVEFWEKVKTKLLNLSQTPKKAESEANAVVKEIITRYGNEIMGNFKPSHYKMARRIVKFFFSRLLNAARIKKFGSFWSKEYTLQDKIQIVGEIEQVRNLAKIGTIVMVPTHFSNIDSVTMGYVLNTLGLPPFIYGAGLNLFNIELFAYFMNSLGAYKVDRRKKNLPYLETLRTYSSLAIRKGCHSLFFPGGTRSRSGKIENKLKLGLLGTAIEAQRINYQNNESGRQCKIFVVPVTLNYNFVLEAPRLINDYLLSMGQERFYTDNDEYSNSYKMLKFMVQFFTKGSNISVSIGKSMDLFGNYVDHNGMSVDRNGNRINTRDYFMLNGVITKDPQREQEYTRMLSEKIVEEYHRINRVFASHLVSFTAFQMLRKKYKKMDLYSMMRLPLDEVEIPYEEFRDTFDKLRDRIIILFNEGKLDIANHLVDDLDEVITLGIDNAGLYHSKRPLVKTREGNITSQDLTILYYYHNRMEGYELEKYI